MVSEPGYDPNQVKNTSTYQQLNSDKSAPLLNRALQSTYPPGSTMKVVTAAAALDSGKFTPNSVLSGHSPQVIGGVPLSNAGGEEFGDINMTRPSPPRSTRTSLRWASSSVRRRWWST